MRVTPAKAKKIVNPDSETVSVELPADVKVFEFRTDRAYMLVVDQQHMKVRELAELLSAPGLPVIAIVRSDGAGGITAMELDAAEIWIKEQRAAQPKTQKPDPRCSECAGGYGMHQVGCPKATWSRQVLAGTRCAVCGVAGDHTWECSVGGVAVRNRVSRLIQ